MDLKNATSGVEQSFADSLKDVVTIASKLASYCPATEDLVNVCKLALESDSQLKLLINLLAAQANRR